MSAIQPSSKAKTMSAYNNIQNIADIGTRVIADTDVREPQNVQFSQRVGVFADNRTSPPLRGDALSAIPKRAEMRGALHTGLEQSSSNISVLPRHFGSIL